MNPQQLTEEDIKKMTPEQLHELQKQNCVFCHIANGKIPSKKVYEDEVVLAVLDINPASQGHTMIIPKIHATITPQLTKETMAHIAITTKIISQAILKAFKARGTSIFIANGPAAGQRAGHAVIHIIPRTEGDGILLQPGAGRQTTDKGLGTRDSGLEKPDLILETRDLKHETPDNNQQSTSSVDLDELARLMK